LLRAEIDTRRGALALTANDEVNYLFIQKVKEEAKTIALYCALKTDTESLTAKMLHETDAQVAFGKTLDIDLWNRRFDAGQVYLQVWQPAKQPPAEIGAESLVSEYTGNGLIAAVVRRNDKLSPVGDGLRIKKTDQVYFFVFEADLETAARFLDQKGWRRIDSFGSDAFSTSMCSLLTRKA
jgi:hypothetical protein